MAKHDQLQTEQEHHRKAFELYFSLGSKRTYRQVAQQLDVAPRTVKLWARSFGWRERIAERETAEARRIADRAMQSGLDEVERNHKIVEMAIVRLAKAIAEGKVRMQLGDLERLLRLQQMVAQYRDCNRVPETVDQLAAHMMFLFTKIPMKMMDEALDLLQAREDEQLKARGPLPGDH